MCDAYYFICFGGGIFVQKDRREMDQAVVWQRFFQYPYDIGYPVEEIDQFK